MTDVTLRSATPDDIEPLAAFIIPFVDDRKILPRTTDELADLVPTMFVAEFEGEIVGCAALEIYSNKLAELRSLAVSPTMQGRGIGKRLAQACLDLAHKRQVFEVMAITSSDAFFQALGFDYTLASERRALFYQTRDDM